MNKFTVGLILLIIGVALLLVGGVSYTTQQRTQIGPIAIMHPEEHRNGQRAQPVIPQKTDSHSVYLRDQAGMHPVVLQDRAVSRDQFVRSNPIIVEHRAEPQHPDWLGGNGWVRSAADNSSLIGQKRSRVLWPRQ